MPGIEKNWFKPNITEQEKDKIIRIGEDTIKNTKPEISLDDLPEITGFAEGEMENSIFAMEKQNELKNTYKNLADKYKKIGDRIENIDSFEQGVDISTAIFYLQKEEKDVTQEIEALSSRYQAYIIQHPTFHKLSQQLDLIKKQIKTLKQQEDLLSPQQDPEKFYAKAEEYQKIADLLSHITDPDTISHIAGKDAITEGQYYKLDSSQLN